MARPSNALNSKLERQDSRAQHLQRLISRRGRKLVEQVVRPAVIVLNRVRTAAAPVEARLAERAAIVVCHVHCAGDLAVTAAIMSDSSGTKHEYDPVPREVTLHRQIPSDDENAGSGGISAECQIAVHHDRLKVRHRSVIGDIRVCEISARGS